MSDLVKKTIGAFQEVTAKDSKVKDVWVNQYKFDQSTVNDHQFVFFLKPEVTAVHAGVKVEAVLETALARLAEAKINIGAVRVLSGDYLNEHNTMGEHYGVISNISRKGLDVLTEGAKAKLNELYTQELKEGATVLGAHQLLEKEKELSPFSLRVFNDNFGTKKLAGGTYGMKLNVLGKIYIVLNPFHPYQLVPYTTSGHAIIVFEGISKLSWKDLRNNICGVTDPEAAAAGSLRRILLEKKDGFGLADVNKSNNGCHMSAGPLEALVELKRFFGIQDDQTTSFGALLTSKGVSAARIVALGSNVDINVAGKTESAFDATEENDATVAATKLTSAL